MPDASPAKWHLAHTSWFFETFVLKPFCPGYQEPDPAYAYLFNSYYVQAGDRHCRAQRGFITRPTVQETYAYRARVDQAVAELLGGAGEMLLERLAPRVTLGLHHEQQHQELLVTDLKYLFSCNPLRPAYRAHSFSPAGGSPALEWVPFAGGLAEIGHAGEGFCYDNETPRHRVYLEPFALANRLVTNGEYLAFVADGGYRRPELWLSEGWATAAGHGWEAPLYWERSGGEWHVFTTAGMQPLDPHEPVCHASLFEADAYARWCGARLPTEAEWEVASAGLPITGSFLDDGRCHPAGLGSTVGSQTDPSDPSDPSDRSQLPAADCQGPLRRRPPTADCPLHQMFGTAWEWTSSAYAAYPGFRPLPGALGEYNGKFMCNQFVLRGGSCATPRSHIRPTYRNFFPPQSRWQFTGIRMARDG
jgi:ergothioneine biosynthesis protein EgtB